MNLRHVKCNCQRHAHTKKKQNILINITCLKSVSKKKQKHTHAYYDTPQKIKKTKILGNIQMNNVKIPKVFQARSYMNIKVY